MAANPSFSGGYIVRSLALGLNVDQALKQQQQQQQRQQQQQPVERIERRQSLTQRLGLSSASSTKGKEQQLADTATPSSGGSGNDEDIEADSQHKQQQSQRVARSKKQSKPAKIECVDVCGSDVYVGTSNGRLLHYSVAPVSVETEAAPAITLVQAVDLLGAYSGKRVEQVLALPGQNKLAVVCASTLAMYQLSDLTPLATAVFQPIRGVSCASLDERIPRSADVEAAGLCVACLRSIQLYRLTATEVRLEQEFPLSSSVASLSHYGNYVCLADSETYKIIDIRKKRSSDGDGELPLLPTQQPFQDPETGRIVRPPRPRTLVVGANEFMFLTSSGADMESDTLGVIVTALGEARRGTLQFTAYPKSVFYDDPFVVAVFASGKVEVHDTSQPDTTLVQSFAFADVDEHTRPKRLCSAVGAFVAIESVVSETIDADVSSIAGLCQLREKEDLKRDAVEQGILEPSGPGKPLSRVSRARIVAVASDALYYVVREPPILRVTRLIDDQRIEEAMAIVESAQQAGSPARIPGAPKTAEAQYCIQLASLTCLSNMLLDDALQYFRRGLMDPRALLHLFPDIVDYLGPLLVPFARIPMPSRLRAMFCDIGDIDALISRGAAQLLAEDSSAEQAASLASALMANTLEVLERYLRYCRSAMRSEDGALDGLFSPDALPVIDTALARLYAVNSRHDKLCALLQDPASAVVSDLAAGYFLQAKHYYYFSLVHKAQGNVRGVLDAWRRIIDGEWADERFGGLNEYLQYVQLTDSQSTMLTEFSWLVDQDVGAALQLLTHLTDQTVELIDADQAFASIETQGGDGPMRVFIERLLSAKHPRATHYMTYLVTAYVRQIAEYYSVDSRTDNLVQGYKRAQADDLRLRFRSYLRTRSSVDEGAALHTRLLGILIDRQSQYDVQAVLESLDAETVAGASMHIERAVILVITGKTDDALNALVFDFGDYAEAELLLAAPDNPKSLARLCPQEPPPDLPRSVNRLLRMYLDIGKTRGDDDEMSARLVSDLLRRFADVLDPSVLADVPDHWPISIVEPFVCRHLQALTAQEQTSDIARSLNQARAFASKLENMHAVCDKGPITLDYSQTCSACNKLLGSSMFVFISDTSEIKHISCL
ncbi:hypothetical protein LPJ56_000192 [Coemansia sp. RSA 2599]|nr:hypothetical protein LPJ56_000192 [Coemansia sp. RSA 2599]